MAKESKHKISKDVINNVDLGKLMKAKPTQAYKEKKEEELIELFAEKPDNKIIFYAIFGIAVLTFLVFANTLSFGPVFNDNSTLSFLGHINNWSTFWNSLWAQCFSQPLTQQWLKASYAIDYSSARYNYSWFHFVNIFFHIASCIYLFGLIYRITYRLKQEHLSKIDPLWMAGLTTALFAVHPLVSESVGYISGRYMPLMAANYLLGLNAFLFAYLAKTRTSQFWGYFTAVACFFMAITTSVEAISFPLVALLICIILKKPELRFLEWFGEHKIVLSILPVSLAAMPYLSLPGMSIQAGNGIGLAVLSNTAYWATKFKSFFTYYLRVLFVPFGLTLDPPQALANGFNDPLVFAGIAAFAASIFCLYYFRANRLIFLGLSVFILGLLPSATIVQPEVISDKHFYMSLIGAAIITSTLLLQIDSLNHKQQVITFACIIMTLSGLTAWRNMTWQNNMVFWTNAVSSNAESSRAQAMLALEYLHANKLPQAKEHANLAVKLDPSVAPAYLAQAAIDLQEKNYEDAISNFSKADELAKAQNLSQEIKLACQSGLAEAYLNAGKLDQAFSAANMAMSTDSSFARLHYIIGRCFLEKGNVNQAYMELTQALKSDPSIYDAWAPLARAALSVGDMKIAYTAAAMMVIKDKSDQAQLIFAKAAIAMGNEKEARKTLTEVIKNSPRNAEALALMSLIEERTGHSKEAQQYHDKAMAIDPSIYSHIEFVRP